MGIARPLLARGAARRIGLIGWRCAPLSAGHAPAAPVAAVAARLGRAGRGRARRSSCSLGTHEVAALDAGDRRASAGGRRPAGRATRRCGSTVRLVGVAGHRRRRRPRRLRSRDRADRLALRAGRRAGRRHLPRRRRRRPRVAGSTSGRVYALDAASGTLRWTRRVATAEPTAVYRAGRGRAVGGRRLHRVRQALSGRARRLRPARPHALDASTSAPGFGAPAGRRSSATAAIVAGTDGRFAASRS